MARQQYLDATRQAVGWTTPVEWEAMADAWDNSTFNQNQTEPWILAGLEDPDVATILDDKGATAEDVALLPAPVDVREPMEEILLSIALMRALRPASLEIGADQKQLLIDEVTSALASLGVTLTVT